MPVVPFFTTFSKMAFPNLSHHPFFVMAPTISYKYAVCIDFIVLSLNLSFPSVKWDLAGLGGQNRCKVASIVSGI